MLDIVQILRRNRFLVFAENARREVLQSPPLCLPGFADRPAEALLVRCHCHSLGDTRISVTAGGIRVKKSLVFGACRSALGPEGPAEPLYVRRHGGDPAPLGLAERKVSERSGEDRSCRFRTRLEFPPVTESSVPETLKKYPCFAAE